MRDPNDWAGRDSSIEILTLPADHSSEKRHSSHRLVRHYDDVGYDDDVNVTIPGETDVMVLRSSKNTGKS